MATQVRTSTIAIGMMLFPNLTQLDFTAPYEVFSRLPDAKVYLLAPTLEPIYSESGFCLFPNTSFERSPALDVLFVPGGLGVNAKLEDAAFLHFLKTPGEHAGYVTSVCTGSLLLAAAGLLQGYRATTHWFYMELLEMFGVETVADRVVIDRNRITSGGVTAGIDFGLVLAAQLYGEMVAQEIQLWMEYNPAPPFQSGSPQTASPNVVENARAEGKRLWETRRQIIQRITYS
jgi:cyclohexyl-isocyanide hydratase